MAGVGSRTDLQDQPKMRNRLILGGLGILLILVAVVILALSRVDPPPPQAASAIADGHDHATELLPPAPVGRTLFGGNSGELRASPVASRRVTPVVRFDRSAPALALEVFAPARFQATPPPEVRVTAAAGP